YSPYPSSASLPLLRPTFLSFYFFFYSPPPHRDLHSFPTRRSSDLSTRSCCRRGGPPTSSPTSMASCSPTCGRSWCFRGRSGWHRSEEHTSELQSLTNLVCRLLLEKKKKSTC